MDLYNRLEKGLRKGQRKGLRKVRREKQERIREGQEDPENNFFTAFFPVSLLDNSMDKPSNYFFTPFNISNVIR